MVTGHHKRTKMTTMNILKNILNLIFTEILQNDGTPLVHKSNNFELFQENPVSPKLGVL